MTSTRTSAWTSGTARTRSPATATMCSAPTSSTTAATSRWGTHGTTSTSLRSGARRSGRTRRRVILRLRSTSGGSGTTNQTRRIKIDPAWCNSAPPGPTRRATTPRKRGNQTKENKMKLAETELNREVVSEAEWLIARKDLLTREREFTRQRDALSAARRQLPMVKIDKKYVFDGPKGKETLAELFDGRSQLIVYHFMLGPGWGEGCKSCSYLADHFDGANRHLPHRDVAFVVVSRAPLPEIQAYQKRMGWRFKWLSSHGTDFNFDYHVSATEEEKANDRMYYNYEKQTWANEEMPGLSVFCKDENGDVCHTYSTYGRVLDIL